MKVLSSLSWVLALLYLLQSPLGAQTVNPTISIQGTLKNANGGAIEDDNKSVTFHLFDALSGGNSVWSETATVEVNGGIYSHLLGSVTPLQATYFTGPRFVEVVVDNVALTPRTTLSYAPYALVVETAQSALSVASGACTGQVGDVKYSILNPTQFIAENGDCWAPMDGRSMQGSRLAGIIGRNNVPDMSGLFIRAQEYNLNRDDDRNSDSPIATVQVDTYKSHSHQSQSSGGHTHTTMDSRPEGLATGNVFNVGGYATGGVQRSGSGAALQYTVAGGDGLRLLNREDEVTTSAVPGHTHPITASGSAETRPENMNFYVYIRIN